MANEKVVTRQEWLQARLALMEQEKALTRQRDALAAARRALPRVLIDQPYRFATPGHAHGFADLFRGKSQLIVYHFMFGPDWEQGCPSCSFWADNYNGVLPHLAARDINLVAVSSAAPETLAAYRERMGWSFEWFSSAGPDFNRDFGVTFEPGATPAGANNYNFATQRFGGEEAPGASVFCREPTGEIYHTYSCYSRGLDALNAAYQLMDLVPRGRDEEQLEWPMAWLRRRDQYEE